MAQLNHILDSVFRNLGMTSLGFARIVGFFVLCPSLPDCGKLGHRLLTFSFILLKPFAVVTHSLHMVLVFLLYI